MGSTRVASRASPPPLTHVNGLFPVPLVFPALVGQRTVLRQRVLDELDACTDASLFLVPIDGKRVWRVRCDAGGRNACFEEFDAFDNPSALVDHGIGDEELNLLIVHRLEHSPIQGNHGLFLGDVDNLHQWRVCRLPRDGVAISQRAGIANLLCFSVQDPTYFDLAVTELSGNDNRSFPQQQCTLMYNCRDNVNGRHSGDQRISLDRIRFLVHSAQLSLSAGKTVAVWMSGYQSTPLHRFAGDRPTLLLLDAEHSIVYFVPIRLDTTSAQQHTSCVAAVCKQLSDDRLFVMPTSGVYGSGDVSSADHDMLRSAQTIVQRTQQPH